MSNSRLIPPHFRLIPPYSGGEHSGSLGADWRLFSDGNGAKRVYRLKPAS